MEGTCKKLSYPKNSPEDRGRIFLTVGDKTELPKVLKTFNRLVLFYSRHYLENICVFVNGKLEILHFILWVYNGYVSLWCRWYCHWWRL